MLTQAIDGGATEASTARSCDIASVPHVESKSRKDSSLLANTMQSNEQNTLIVQV